MRSPPPACVPSPPSRSSATTSSDPFLPASRQRSGILNRKPPLPLDQHYERLRLNQSAILDSVATFERIRSSWRFLAAQYGAAFRVVECVCSDRELRRRRLEVRNRGIPGWPELSWEEAESVGARYEPWQDDRLVLDTVHPLEENLDALHSYLL